LNFIPTYHCRGDPVEKHSLGDSFKALLAKHSDQPLGLKRRSRVRSWSAKHNILKCANRFQPNRPPDGFGK
jgi:hypothetical protein